MAVAPARFWEREQGGRIHCTLCPRDCRLAEGQHGFCYVRQNVGGEMQSLAWGRSTGFAVDPIEKKPLNHFYPGTSVLSFGTAGCNLGCRFCQNWDISKARDTDRMSRVLTPEQVVGLAVSHGSPSIAFTYNDPIIWAEWAIACAREARSRGIRTVFVSNGYVGAEAREEIFREMDAANIDLKAFTEEFYAKVTLSHLAPVLETLAWLAKHPRTWVEVTNLVIPGLNDDPAETRRLAEWIGANMGPDVPLHFSAFHPDFKMVDVGPTPPRTLTRAREIAREVGLRYVYTGNVHDPAGQTTWCPKCGAAVVERDWYRVRKVGLRGNVCADCGTVIAGRFDPAPAPRARA